MSQSQKQDAPVEAYIKETPDGKTIDFGSLRRVAENQHGLPDINWNAVAERIEEGVNLTSAESEPVATVWVRGDDVVGLDLDEADLCKGEWLDAPILNKYAHLEKEP